MGLLCGCASRPDAIPTPWDAHFPRMTRPDLRRKREYFWDTRTSGFTEIWRGLQSAVELLRDGDEETSKAIVDAMGCTEWQRTKSGHHMLCYDERGRKYEVPMWMFEEPRNLVENQGLDQMKQGNVGDESDEDNSTVKNQDITFTVRLSIGRDVTVTINEQNTIEGLKEDLSSQLNKLDPSKIRIMARGRMLKNDYLISSPFRIRQGDVIHASFLSTLYIPPDEVANPQQDVVEEETV